MSIRNLIILSQLNPPAPRSRILNRERVEKELRVIFNYPLTVIQAGMGFGKSTAILSLLQKITTPIYWYTISGTDRDPKLFLAKLFTAFNQNEISIGDEALRILDMPDATQEEALIALLNSITKNIHKDTLLILDDFHRVSDVPEIIDFIDWMVNRLPPKLHLVVITRHHPDFPSLNKWIVKGDVIKIDKQVLAFTPDEIKRLFGESYGISLSDKTVPLLLKRTEGWAIGLQIVWQTLQSHPGMSIDQVLEDSSQSRGALFEYLAEEVLAGLEPKIKNFLLTTSVLSKLDSETCDFILNINNSDEILRLLYKKGLFIEELRPGLWRYHQIFREFLTNRLHRSGIDVNNLHMKIASYFRAHEYWEEAIYHLLSAEEFHQVNQILENIGDSMINDGRYESINYWINEIPENVRKDFPYLSYLLGEVNRYLEKFDQALENYHKAERVYRKQENNLGISLALMGQGQVFLDTIRPINADQHLQNALARLNPSEMPREYSDLLVLIAENQLNLGDPENAEVLLNKAKKLRLHLDMDTDLIQARIYLRTGRFQEGIDLLHDREANNPKLPISRPQRFHRESTLLLSLFYSFVGDNVNAEKYALQGIEIGKSLQSTFVQSVGFMRLGHALLLHSQAPFIDKGFESALNNFQKSIDNIEVTRIHVEPLWGMCRALGYTGHIQQAQQLALESISIAQKAGDQWISVLIQLSIGAGAVITKNFDLAEQYLTSAEAAAIKVKDPFTLCVARMWLAIKAWEQGYTNTAFGYLEKLLLIIEKQDYSFLFTRETLMGLKDPEKIFPLFIAAYENGIQKELIHKVYKIRGLDEVDYHPGYSLWIRTFGEFKVWRGDQIIEPHAWKREKAHHFFELLVANRDKWLHRDQINLILWADTPVENATNYLKVVYSTLNQVLEPDRPRGAQPFFIERRQESYRLNPKARIIVDADLFDQEITKGTIPSLEHALNLYKGKYFADCFIQEWQTIEEQYYHQQYLMASEKLLAKLIDEKDYEKALQITYEILACDSLWESAYRTQMKIFHLMGQHGMVRKVYNQCIENFQDKLSIPVSRTTIDLLKTLERNGK